MYIDVKIGEPYSCQISNVLGGQLLRPARAQIPTLQPDTLGGRRCLVACPRVASSPNIFLCPTSEHCSGSNCRREAFY